jgi:hypothetical protein
MQYCFFRGRWASRFSSPMRIRPEFPTLRTTTIQSVFQSNLATTCVSSWAQPISCMQFNQRSNEPERIDSPIDSNELLSALHSHRESRQFISNKQQEKLFCTACSNNRRKQQVRSNTTPLMLTSLKSPLSKQPASRCASTATKFQNINNNNKTSTTTTTTTKIVPAAANKRNFSCLIPTRAILPSEVRWRRSGPAATKRLRGHGMPTISSCTGVRAWSDAP